ncbi:hypothetical protein GCM10011297_10280 [Bacterioplanes sanyensis]|nr:hypothetical protein GCM10011297_10280 [Bacterioplanes sanyensis]
MASLERRDVSDAWSVYAVMFTNLRADPSQQVPLAVSQTQLNQFLAAYWVG